MAGASSSSSSFAEILTEIPELRGDNFKIWKERVLLHLGCADMDYAIRKDEPAAITATSTAAQIALYEKWERSNRLSIMFIMSKIPLGMRGSVEQPEKVKDLIKLIDEQFDTSDKPLYNNLIHQFSSTKLTGVKGVREHISKMRDISAQLKKLDVVIPETFLVHYILNHLPPQYGPFKISYNTHKDKWSINELITMCAQEEARLLQEQGESAHMATQGKKRKPSKKDKGKNKVPPQGDIKKDSIKCFFCKKKGHAKKECAKFKKWMDDNGFTKPKEASGK
ncbi:uncharacterized protein LOC133793461 [Humulus lupulus]|uniref:uncharacterized protein LOC133793461 n=2 Tax=Humulus lupulus TaxID=3486 RepID=UPI002B401A08|nr:uncharacterized protein LOC133793461 [Humulus lupulus]